MKRVLALMVGLFCAVAAFAQEKPMASSGQSGASEEARYVLGLVRNGYADLLNKYFDAAPWKIQTEIDSYTDNTHEASIAVFCVAVDLGNVEVVKAFVEHGYGPADLCRVQRFGTKKVIISRAERLYADRSVKESSYSSSSKRGGSGGVWFGPLGAGGVSQGGSSSSEQANTIEHKDITDKYSQVWYGEKKVVKTYFANPLDFASGEMFDYLWEQGFRSNNLFTKQALAEAKRLGRMDIWTYIMENKPELLADKPSYVSEEDYAALLQAAKAGPETLAYRVLEKGILGRIGTSAQAEQVKKRLSQELQQQLQKGNVMPADTLGYSRMDKAVKEKAAEVKRAEERAAQARAAAAAAEAKKQAEAKAAAEAVATAEAEMLAKRRELVAEFQEGARKTQSAFLASPTLPEVLKTTLSKIFSDRWNWWWPSKITVYRNTECERVLHDYWDNHTHGSRIDALYPSNKDQYLTVWEIKVEGHSRFRVDPARRLRISKDWSNWKLLEENGVIKKEGFLEKLICQQDKGFWSSDWQTVPLTRVGTWTAPPYEGPVGEL